MSLDAYVVIITASQCNSRQEGMPIDGTPPGQNLADVLDLLGCLVLGAQVDLEGPAEQLEQDLEARLGDGGVVPALAQLVADEGVLGPGELVEVEDHARLPQLGADEVAAGVVDVGVLDAEDHRDLALEPGEEVQGVVAAGRRRGRGVCALVGAEGARVDVRREVADRCGDAGVKLACCQLF